MSSPRISAWLDRRGPALGWIGFAIVLVSATADIVIRVTHPDGQSSADHLAGLFYTADPVAFAAVGAAILSRVPRSRIGWLALAAGLAQSFEATLQSYAQAAYAGGGLPGDHWAAWATDSFWPGSFLTFFLLLLLFPTGRLLSPQWRPAAWLAVASCALFCFIGLVQTGSMVDFERWKSPIPRVPVLSALAEHNSFMAVLLPVVSLVCVAALIVRVVRSRGQERAQLKWVVWSTGVFVVVGLVGSLPRFDVASSVGQNVVMLLIPISIGVAITRHNLYEIDRIISRTVSYAVLTGLLIGVYAGVVAAATRLSPLSNSLGVAVSTLAVAALFQPLRRRVQGVVDRRFNRARYDSQRTIDAFSARLRHQVDLDALEADLVAVVRQTVQPTHVSLWLRGPAGAPETG